MNNLDDENPGEAGRAKTAIPSASTTRADGMNSSTGLLMEAERLSTELTGRTDEASMKATQAW